MLRVGLTGGTGAGKSTVAARFAELGARVIDADRLAREVVEPGSEGLAAVLAEFGTGVLRPDGALDRPALGQLVFADPQARERLNAVTHPRIAALTARRIALLPADAVLVHDVPLLVENRMGAGYHLVVVVEAPTEERVYRLVRDRGMNPADARARIAAQATPAERSAAADVVLTNDGDQDSLLATVDALWRDRLVKYERFLRVRRIPPRPPAVEVIAPDRRWPDQAARLAARIHRAAGPWMLRLDHTGSTAIPGLPGRDVIDLQLVVAHLSMADRIADALADAGYPRMPGEAWDDDLDGGPPLPKRMHGSADPARPVHLHVRVADGPAWCWQLIFRDWLTAHPAERDAYAEVKLAASGSSRSAYGAAKRPWIEAAQDRARDWARAVGWRPGTALVRPSD